MRGKRLSGKASFSHGDRKKREVAGEVASFEGA